MRSVFFAGNIAACKTGFRDILPVSHPLSQLKFYPCVLHTTDC